MRTSRKKLTFAALMSTRSTIIAALLLGLAAVTSARAESHAIRGTVKGADGKPLAGAEVRAQRVDGRGTALVTTTNAKGEYSFRGLDVAGYKVTAVVNKVPKSTASINTRKTGWVAVDFDLRAGKAPKKKHLVWVAGETGTHIGGGHWEEVEEPATGKGASAMERIDGHSVNTPGQSPLNPTGGISGGGQ